MNDIVYITKENSNLIDKKIAYIKKCNRNEINDILNLQDESIEHINYLIPFTFEELDNVFKNQNNVYGCYLENKLIAFINFTIILKEDNNNLLYNIGINDISGNIDGVIVHPKYLGNGLQRILMNYIETIAKKCQIHHLVADVSPENTYSLNNLLNCGYKIEGKYIKENKFEKYIVHKII